MAETKVKNDEMVEVFIDRPMGKDEPNMLVGINGVNYLLPRGKTTKVPKAVYDEIMRSRRAQGIADFNADKLKEAAQQPK